jgi:hypothetical protein
VQAAPHRFPIPGAGSGEDKSGAAGPPETGNLLPATGSVLSIQAAEPPCLLVIYPPLHDLLDKIATELEFSCRNPELLVPAAAFEHLASGIEQPAFEFVIHAQI